MKASEVTALTADAGRVFQMRIVEGWFGTPSSHQTFRKFVYHPMMDARVMFTV